MATITINGDSIKLSDKALASNKVQFADISEKCSECGNDLEEAGCIRGTDLVCGCGQKYPITTSAKGSKEEPVKEAKTEKKSKKIETKAEKVKVEKKVSKPAKAKKKVKTGEATAREGSINAAKLIDTKKGEPREGSAPEMILKYFKKATTPVSVIDSIVAEWKKSRDLSPSFEKNPRGYISWYVLDLLRKGWLKKA